MEKHPYTSSSGQIVQIIEHLRKSIPPVVDATTLKKLGLASQNESYIINILLFINILSEEGTPTDLARKVFSLHDNVEFQKEFSEMVKTAYLGLFKLHGDAAWKLDLDKLISFFRNNDQTSSVVGTRQARTFLTLATISGKSDEQKTTQKKPSVSKKGEKHQINKGKKATPSKEKKLQNNDSLLNDETVNKFGLTVRIEINLPAQADQETYDRIFKSIKENLLNA